MPNDNPDRRTQAWRTVAFLAILAALVAIVGLTWRLLAPDPVDTPTGEPSVAPSQSISPDKPSSEPAPSGDSNPDGTDPGDGNPGDGTDTNMTLADAIGDCSSETYDPDHPPAGAPSHKNVLKACDTAAKFAIAYGTHTYKDKSANTWIDETRPYATDTFLASYAEMFAEADDSPEWKQFVKDRTETNVDVAGAGVMADKGTYSGSKLRVGVSVAKSIRTDGGGWTIGAPSLMQLDLIRDGGIWKVNGLPG